MARTSIAFFLLVCSSLWAIDHYPSFPPLWEFQAKAGYLFEHQPSSEGSDIHTLDTQLELTFWPYWNAQFELLLSETSDFDLSYQIFIFDLRYMWWECDPFNLALGLNFFFPATRALSSRSFPYHGRTNLELHASGGVSWLWLFAGIGSAEKGHPWLRTVLGSHIPLTYCLEWRTELRFLAGLGSEKIERPFQGFAHVGHQTLDLRSELVYQVSYIGFLRLSGWVNLYEKNFPRDRYGAEVLFHLPFGL